MNREHRSWHSPALGRDMDLIVHGHAGARVVVFPTSKGRYFDWENRKLHETIGEHLENGWLQLFCVDSVDEESWQSGGHLGDSAWRHTQYDKYILDEVLPFTESINSNPYLIVVGASFGGYHAVTFGLRHPDRVNRILSMSGVCDIGLVTKGYTDENVYLNNPIDFIPNEHDEGRLEALRRQDIIIVIGKEDPLYESNRRLSDVLWSKGIGNALREWDGYAHDWPVWEQMLPMYIGGHD